MRPVLLGPAAPSLERRVTSGGSSPPLGGTAARVSGRACSMGSCCRRQSAKHGEASEPWKLYSDREEEWTVPSTTAQRDRRWRPSTTSLGSGELERFAQDESRPRRAQHAADELARRAKARS